MARQYHPNDFQSPDQFNPSRFRQNERNQSDRDWAGRDWQESESRERRNFDRDYIQDRDYQSQGGYWRQSGSSPERTGERRNQRTPNERPIEWDDRQYGRDFDEPSRETGSNIYGMGANRQAWGDVGSDQQYGSSFYGSRGGQLGHPQQSVDWARRRSTWTEGRNQRGGFGDAGRDNYGSSKYGGSEYLRNDYGPNPSRYGSPYSRAPETRSFGREQFGDTEYSDDQNEVIGSDWSRTRARGEWRQGSDFDRQRSYGEGSYGQGSYDEGSPSSSRRGPQSTFQSGQSQQWGGGGAQSHAGRGPKGYQRSDERIKEIICEALMEAPYIDASEISVEVKNREIVLSGNVPDRQTKYAAEELAERKAGSCDIRNELRVRKQENRSEIMGQGSGQSSGVWSTSPESRQDASKDGKQSALKQEGSNKTQGDKLTDKSGKQ